MNLKRFNIYSLILLLWIILAAPPSVFGQETERHEAFVYGINAAAPDGVAGTFAPPAVDTIYLLAGETSILSPRITNIYFWPLTNEYRASWSSLNESVEGSLEIRRGLQKVAVVEQTTYTIQFHVNEEGGNEHALFVGEEAVMVHAQFEADQRAYQDAVLAYEEAQKAWLVANRERPQEEAAADPLPDPPVEPAPFKTMSNGLNQGFPVNLDAGSYRIRTRRADGSVVPTSERRLIVFAPRRKTIGYELLPEHRWTIPDESNEPETVILGVVDTIVYLKPYLTGEYPALPYHRLQNPQDRSANQADEWIWVSSRPLRDVVMERLSSGDVLEQIPLLPYTVKQTAGVDRGYEILPYDGHTPDITPRIDFVAFRLPFMDEEQNFAIQLRSMDGTVLDDSQRAVRVVGENSLLNLELIAALPLLLGVIYFLWRRRGR